MQIIRAEHSKENPYVMISREVVCFTKLSGLAFKILVLALTLRNGNCYSVEWFYNKLDEPQNNIAKAINELIEQGYFMLIGDALFVFESLAVREDYIETYQKHIKENTRNTIELPIKEIAL